MKRNIFLYCIVSIGAILIPYSSFALLHISNSSLRFECIYCHPEGVGGGLPKTPCLDCHNNSDSNTYTDESTIAMSTHSSEVMGSNAYGDWERECVDCHDPHNPNGINIYDGISDSSYVLVDLDADQPLNDSVTHSTTFTVMTDVTVHDAAWADPADWGGKTSPERGLLFLVYSSVLKKYYWYEVISATDTTITISTESYFRVPLRDGPIHAQLVYGMLINNEVLAENSENEVVPFPVVYSRPNSMADNDGLGENGTDSTPDGICQVCHTQTSVWRNDGSAGDHFNGWECTYCHHHEQGFKFVSPSP